MPKTSKPVQCWTLEEERRRQKCIDWELFLKSYPYRLVNLVYEYSRRPELSVRKESALDLFSFSCPGHMSEKWFPLKLSESDLPKPELIDSLKEVEQTLQSVILAENRIP